MSGTCVVRGSRVRISVERAHCLHGEGGTDARSRCITRQCAHSAKRHAALSQARVLAPLDGGHKKTLATGAARRDFPPHRIRYIDANSSTRAPKSTRDVAPPFDGVCLKEIASGWAVRRRVPFRFSHRMRVSEAPETAGASRRRTSGAGSASRRKKIAALRQGAASKRRISCRETDVEIDQMRHRAFGLGCEGSRECAAWP